MISYSILHRAKADRATHYYGDQADDYYSREGGAATWQGAGAKALGAVGEVDIQRFHMMLRGEFGRGVKAGRSIRHDAKARAAIDLTFSAPKSITLQALIGNDARLIQAHDAAVTYTLRHIEEHFALARQKENYKVRVERTGNLIMAKFRHETARPTPDAAPDPNLHTHAVIMNATQRADGTWAALSNEEIVKYRKLQDAIYNAQLDHLVRKLGYEVRYEKGHIELAHISREHIETFSKRSAQIEAQLDARGLTRDISTHGQRQTATLATRLVKSKDLSRNELYHGWVQQAKAAGIDFEARGVPTFARLGEGGETPVRPEHVLVDSALNWAIAHMTERETVMPRSELVAYALRHSGGEISVNAIHKAIDRHIEKGQLIQSPARFKSSSDPNVPALTRESWAQEVAEIRNQTHAEALSTVDQAIAQGRLTVTELSYATRRAFEAEQRIVNMERAGRDSVAPVMQPSELDAAVANTTLTAGQKDALRLMLTDTNQIVGIQGIAGTGKSFALQSAQRLLQQRGFSIVALAPYSTQVGSLRADGIQANTVASFLTARDKRRFTDNMGPQTVVVIDEAGVVPVRQMDQLLARITATGARVVTLGNTAQTKAVEAGRAFSLLQEQGMKTVVMGDIQRQKSARLRRAVKLASTGLASQSLPLLDRIACIADSFKEGEHGTKVRDCSRRYQAIAREFVALSEDEQEKTLVVTGTNASREAINSLIRRYRGLEGKGHVHRLLARHDSTQAERACAKYYTEGDIIQPERNYKCGLQQGVLYRVVECARRHDELTVMPLRAGPDTKPITFKPKMARKLSVYNCHEAELSAGDKVRISRNDAKLDLVNGQRADVLEVTPTSVTLGIGERRIELAADLPLHVDHAYATTAHSAQGLTCERVFYNGESFSRTTAQDTYYVGISRERHEVVVFTDDIQALPLAVDRVPYKGLAMDLVGPVKPQMQIGQALSYDMTQSTNQRPAVEPARDRLRWGLEMG